MQINFNKKNLKIKLIIHAFSVAQLLTQQ